VIPIGSYQRKLSKRGLGERSEIRGL